MAVIYPARQIRENIFLDVNLIDPLDIPLSSPMEARKPVLKRRQPPKTDYRRPDLPDEALLPKAIIGRDAVEEPMSSPSSSGIRMQTPAEQSGGNEEKRSIPHTSLFDRETIEKFARKNSPEKKDLSFDVSEFKHRGYMRMLKQKIEGIWKYPKEAAELGISGDLYIGFVIKKDGKLGDVEILRTSGFSGLDKAALKALRNAEPFWPLPEGWDKEDLEIKGHFIYILGNTIML